MAKNIVFVALLVFCGGISGYSQSLYAVIGGAQATSAKYTVREAKQETDFKYGGQAGIMIKIPFENQLYFAPQMYYSLKGYTVSLKDSAFPPGVDAISNEVRVHSIDIAPLFQIDLSKNPGHLFVRIGPSIEAIIKGDEEVGLKNGTTVKQDMKFSFGDYGRVTASLVGHFGYETGNGFMIYAHYGHGVGSMNNADRGPRITHRVAGLSIGKYFGKSKH